MICRKIYETRIHGLCGTTVPGVIVNCEHSKTKCSLDCSPQCSGYVESGSVKTPTVAQRQHNREFIEYTANKPPRTVPIATPRVTPTTISAPLISPQNVIKSTSTNSSAGAPQKSSGCGCGGNSNTQTNYTSSAVASYIR